jgi:hypothetical protein
VWDDGGQSSFRGLRVIQNRDDGALGENDLMSGHLEQRGDL